MHHMVPCTKRQLASPCARTSRAARLCCAPAARGRSRRRPHPRSPAPPPCPFFAPSGEARLPHWVTQLKMAEDNGDKTVTVCEKDLNTMLTFSKCVAVNAAVLGVVKLLDGTCAKPADDLASNGGCVAHRPAAVPPRPHRRPVCGPFWRERTIVGDAMGRASHRGVRRARVPPARPPCSPHQALFTGSQKEKGHSAFQLDLKVSEQR